MNAIVSVNQNWAIGKQGKLLYPFKEDLVHFKNLTFGNTIICGRKTLDSFPNGCPLLGRKNIIITSSESNISEAAKSYATQYIFISKDGNTEELKVKDDIDINDSSKVNTSLIGIDDINMVEKIAMLVSKNTSSIFVCGGETIYQQLLPKVSKVYLTKYEYDDPEADTFFPNLDLTSNWKVISQSNVLTSESGIKYQFIEYEAIIDGSKRSI